jgi:Ni,Fe-hydrogenase III small subunit
MATKVWVGTDSGNEGDYGTAANWSPSGVPIAGDDVIIANTSQSITGTLDQSAVALTSIIIDQSFTGVIGSSASDFLQIASATAVIGQRRGNIGTFTGSKRLNLDFGSSTACQVEIYGTASTAQDTNRTPCRIQAANASTDIKVHNGSVSVSDDSDDTSTVGDIVVKGGTVTAGAGMTLSNVTVTAGTCNVYSSIATLATVKGGVLNMYDGVSANTIATCTVSDSGIVNHYATGTITTLNCNGGTTDLTGNNDAKTVTTVNLDRDATLVIDTSVVTLTNDLALTGSKIYSITVR